MGTRLKEMRLILELWIGERVKLRMTSLVLALVSACEVDGW